MRLGWTDRQMDIKIHSPINIRPLATTTEFKFMNKILELAAIHSVNFMSCLLDYILKVHCSYISHYLI